MFELSINEEIQDKARSDVRKSIEKHDRKLTFDSVADMTYLEQCVNETLRKYPPASSVQRVALEDYNIPDSKIVIPKGTAVPIPILAIHWDEEHYPEPEKFDPERFNQENLTARHPMAFLPFGEGPRNCIGIRFALIEIKLALAKMLMRYKFTLDRSKTDVPLEFSKTNFMLAPAKNIFINISKE